MKFKLPKRLLAAVLALTLFSATAASTSGCYGKFAVTKKIYDWNGTIQNKFLKTLVFWGLLIIPVYEVVMLGDGIIFNVIEFWGGNNPISGGRAEISTRALADGSVEIKKDGAVFQLRQVDARRFRLSKDGAHLADGLLAADGGLIFTDMKNKRTLYFENKLYKKVKRYFTGATSTPQG